MTCTDMRKNDIGAKLIFTVKDCGEIVDMTALVSSKILFKDPTGVVVEQTGVTESPPTDGKVSYTSTDGDFNVVGTWTAQAHLNFGTSSFTSSGATFEVKDVMVVSQ